MERKILIYKEKENELDNKIKNILLENSYKPVIVNNKNELIEKFENEKPQILLIDYQYLNNFILSFFYENKNNVKIFIIAIIDRNILSKKEHIKRIFVLEDFILKPFTVEEILLRIKKVFNNNFDMPFLVNKKYLRIDIKNYLLYINNKQIKAAPKEIKLLYKLAVNENILLTREQLLNEVWGYQYVGQTRTVDVHIKRLRFKLKEISEKCKIETIWGVGYIFKTID